MPIFNAKPETPHLWGRETTNEKRETFSYLRKKIKLCAGRAEDKAPT